MKIIHIVVFVIENTIGKLMMLLKNETSETKYMDMHYHVELKSGNDKKSFLYFHTFRKKKQIKILFSKYVSPKQNEIFNFCRGLRNAQPLFYLTDSLTLTIFNIHSYLGHSNWGRKTMYFISIDNIHGYALQ